MWQFILSKYFKQTCICSHTFQLFIFSFSFSFSFYFSFYFYFFFILVIFTCTHLFLSPFIIAENYWAISIKSVTSLNNIAWKEILKKRHSAAIGTVSANSAQCTDSFSEEKGGTLTLTTISDPHICPRCDKMYAYKKNLSRHLRFECGKKPSERCPHCSYITRYRHSLNTHMKTQHPEIGLTPGKTEHIQ